MNETHILGKTRKRIQNWLRFSVRALIVLVTIVAIWLGLFANQARDQEVAVAAVLGAGGFVQYDIEHAEAYWSMPLAQQPGFKELHSVIPTRWNIRVRQWMRPILGQHFVDNVVTIGFWRNDAMLASDEFVQEQIRQRNLANTAGFQDHASLAYPTLTRDQWKQIQKLKRLEEIHIFDNMVTDDDMRSIAQLLSLRLVFGGTDEITDEGLLYLRQAKKLEIVQFAGDKITDKGLLALQQELPNCRVIP